MIIVKTQCRSLIANNWPQKWRTILKTETEKKNKWPLADDNWKATMLQVTRNKLPGNYKNIDVYPQLNEEGHKNENWTLEFIK